MRQAWSPEFTEGHMVAMINDFLKGRKEKFYLVLPGATRNRDEFILRSFYGINPPIPDTQEEVANSTKCSISTVRRTIAEFRKHIRKYGGNGTWRKILRYYEARYEIRMLFKKSCAS